MGRKEKLLERTRRNSQGLDFNDFEALLLLCGWEFNRQRGSHPFWYSPARYRISIQPMKDGNTISS